jgi:hypothetical protein
MITPRLVSWLMVAVQIDAAVSTITPKGTILAAPTLSTRRPEIGIVIAAAIPVKASRNPDSRVP